MFLKTSLVSTVVGLRGSTEERGARAREGDDLLFFLCSVDTLTVPFPSTAARACVLHWVPRLFPEENSEFKAMEENTNLKAAEKDCSLFVLSIWGILLIFDNRTLL